MQPGAPIFAARSASIEMKHWLLLESNPAPAAENMALDEMMLDRATRIDCPILRIYSFDPPGITVGRNQNVLEILDMKAIRSDGIEVARRITGGGALLHEGEVTYCIASRNGTGVFACRPIESFRMVAEAVVEALKALGLDANISRRSFPSGNFGISASCLSSTTRWEITVRGKKVAGAAQRVRDGAFLQHGSVFLGPGSERIEKYLLEKALCEWENSTNVEEELGERISNEVFSNILKSSFEKIFGGPYERLEVDEKEKEELGKRAFAKRLEIYGVSGGESG